MPDKKTKFKLVCVSAPGEDDRPEGLRVLMLSVSGEMGGAEHSFLEVLRALPKDRIHPYACVPPGGSLERHCQSAEVPVYSVHLRRFRRTTNPFILAGQVKALYQGSRIISDICKTRNIDILYANNDSAALMAWEVSRMAKIPYVWHCRDLIQMHGFARILSASSSAVVAISKTVETHLLKEGVSESKLRRIDNGIDLSRFPSPENRAAVRKRVRATLGIGDDRPVVLAVGAYVPWKRHDVFIDTVAALRAQYPSAIGLLVGSDQVSKNEVYTHLLHDRTQALKLDPNALRLLGERNDVPDLMAAADVLVSCSDNEPFGRVVAEAGATGIPVVSTRSGGKTEIIEDTVTGLLVEPGNVAELTAACARLIDDAALRESIGIAARARIEKMFSIQRTAGELTALFESIAGRREARHV